MVAPVVSTWLPVVSVGVPATNEAAEEVVAEEDVTDAAVVTPGLPVIAVTGPLLWTCLV